MGYDWSDYKGYLAKKIAEDGIFAEGFDSPEELVDEIAARVERNGHTVVGKNIPETFVFKTLNYGIECSIKDLGIDVESRKLELVVA